MKNRIVLGLMIFFVLFLICFLPSFAYYNFLSSEANEYLENLEEKHRVKKIALEKKEGIVWIVRIPKNSGVEIKKLKEAIYNDETAQFEAVYNFTYITILNAQGPTWVRYGFASKFYPYDKVKLCFVYESNNNGTISLPTGTPSDLENWYWLPCGDLEGSGSWIQIVEFESSN